MSFAAATVPSRKDRFYTDYGKKLIHPKSKFGQPESPSSWKKHKKPGELEVEIQKPENPIALSPADSTTIFISSKETWMKEKQIQHAYATHIKELEADLQEMMYWYDTVYNENMEIKKQHGADQVLITEGFGKVIDSREKLRKEEEPHKRKINKLIEDVRGLNRTNKELHEHLNNLRKTAPSIDKERERDAKYHKLYWETKALTSERDVLKKKLTSLSKQYENGTGEKSNYFVPLAEPSGGDHAKKYVYKKKSAPSGIAGKDANASNTENTEKFPNDTSLDHMNDYYEIKRYHDRLCAEKSSWSGERNRLLKASAFLQEDKNKLVMKQH